MTEPTVRFTVGAVLWIVFTVLTLMRYGRCSIVRVGLSIKDRACPVCGGKTGVLRMKRFWNCLDYSGCGALGDIINGRLTYTGLRYVGDGEIVEEQINAAMMRKIDEQTGLAEVQDRMEAVYRDTVPGYAYYLDGTVGTVGDDDEGENDQDLVEAIDYETAKIMAQRYCTQCGAAAGTDDQFCGACGTAIASA